MMGSNGGLSMAKILLVEDDISLIQGLEYALVKEGFSVGRARNAEEGMNMASCQSFDLLLLDVNLPDRSGFELCRELRQRTSVPVIFLTACDEEYNIVRGLDQGGDDYITKPFRVNELISRINAVLRRTTGVREETVIRSGDIFLDCRAARLTRKGENLDLTATEIRLVGVLMSQEGRVVTRAKLMEQLWDRDEHYVDSNTLSVYIRRLREKLEDDAGNPRHIETVRGLGYRWQ